MSDSWTPQPSEEGTEEESELPGSLFFDSTLCGEDERHHVAINGVLISSYPDVQATPG